FPAGALRSVGLAGMAVWLVGTAATLTLAPVLASLRGGRPSATPAPASRGLEPPAAAVVPGTLRGGRPAVAVPVLVPGASRGERRTAAVPVPGALRGGQPTAAVPVPGSRGSKSLGSVPVAGSWGGVSSAVVPVSSRWRILAGAVGAMLLVLLAGASVQLRVGNPEARALVASGPARDGLDRLAAAGVPSGVLNPLEVLVPAGGDAAAVAERASRVPGVLLAAAPSAGEWRRGGTALVVVVPVAEPMTAAGASTVTALRSALADTSALVGGSGVVDRDLVEGVYGLLPYAVPAAALAAFGVLAAFGAAGVGARAVPVAVLAAVAPA
ncbi:hypothetical protein, partial [Streptomyces sp. CBMA370]|nr:hypothetical protein [Streptomyces sp. CBMA370]